MGEQKKPANTERTKQGYEVPIPKRGEFFKNLAKVAKKPKREADSTTGGSEQ